jgi:hypothetical protein
MGRNMLILTFVSETSLQYHQEVISICVHVCTHSGHILASNMSFM